MKHHFSTLIRRANCSFGESIEMVYGNLEFNRMSRKKRTFYLHMGWQSQQQQPLGNKNRETRFIDYYLCLACLAYVPCLAFHCLYGRKHSILFGGSFSLLFYTENKTEQSLLMKIVDTIKMCHFICIPYHVNHIDMLVIFIHYRATCHIAARYKC